ncbi:hypothetical protein QLX67_05375, partial [Balneolaceae bacterium ANBcel3]|nr:hypothetical protein [Balneolaceae bacterium ANBcel3]
MRKVADFSLDKLEFEHIRKALLVYAYSSEGQKVLENLSPAITPEHLSERLQCVSEMLHLIHSADAPPFESLKDVTGALKKAHIERFILDGVHLAFVLSWIRSARLLNRFFSRQKEHVPMLWSIASSLFWNKDLEQAIGKAIDEKGEVREDASPALSRIS